jgi:hypothetical protein
MTALGSKTGIPRAIAGMLLGASAAAASPGDRLVDATAVRTAPGGCEFTGDAGECVSLEHHHQANGREG